MRLAKFWFFQILVLPMLLIAQLLFAAVPEAASFESMQNEWAMDDFPKILMLMNQQVPALDLGIANKVVEQIADQILVESRSLLQNSWTQEAYLWQQRKIVHLYLLGVMYSLKSKNSYKNNIESLLFGFMTLVGTGNILDVFGLAGPAPILVSGFMTVTSLRNMLSVLRQTAVFRSFITRLEQNGSFRLAKPDTYTNLNAFIMRELSLINAETLVDRCHVNLTYVDPKKGRLKPFFSFMRSNFMITLGDK